MAAPQNKRKNILVYATILVLLVILIFPQIKMARQSLFILRHASILPLYTSLIILTLTFFIASTTYHLLSRKPLKFQRTLLVSVANMFTGKLLPAGAGGLATFFLYLRHEKHSISQATSVVSANNLLGFFSHAVLLVALFISSPSSFSGFKFPSINTKYFGVLIFIILVVFMGFLFQRKAYNKFLKIFVETVSELAYYKKHPFRLVGCVGTATALTVCNATVLWLCAQSVHVSVSIFAALAIFSIGIVASSVTPTPGGLGGIEAGLLAGFVAYQIPTHAALAAVILFRLVSYWLTLLIGLGAYTYIERRGYLRPVR